MESRHLGPIALEGGAGGGTMDAAVKFEGESLPVRLEIDFPDQLSETVVADIDMVLDTLQYLHELAVTTIAAGVKRGGTAPAQMFRAWENKRVGRDGKAEEFLERLELVRMTILPDGGKWSAERIVMNFAMADNSVSGVVKVRFLEPTGPELAPAPSGGFS